MVTQDTKISMMLKYFKYITPVADERIVNNQIITEKDNWGAQVF